MARKKSAVQPLQETGISHKLKVSFFIASIVPLAVMTYLYLNYVAPAAEKEGNTAIAVIGMLLLFTVILSVLGLVLTGRAANESINSLKRLNLRMDSLLDVTKNFRESFYIDVLLDSIASSASQILNAEASSILLYDESGTLRFEYVTGKNSAGLKGKAVNPGEGITGWVAQEMKPLIINDVHKDPRFSDRHDRETGFRTRSIVCVPLVIEGRNIGVVEVVNKKDGEPFTEQDQKILFSLGDHAAISIQRSKNYESSHSDLIQITDILITAMDYHVPEKKGHARRVARYAVKLAKSMGLNEEEQKKIYFAALLHDIGLLKYDQDEYWGLKKFEMHPTLGYEMMKAVTMWQPMAPLVLSHHERYDGSGYPRGLSGQDIPLGARIISLAEVFDIMASSKSYKPARGFQEAVDEIRNNSGVQFDPHVVDIFLASVRKEDVSE